MEENELQKRLFLFAVDVIKMLRTLKGGIELNIIINQLVKSSSSAGANYEESQAAISRAELGLRWESHLKRCASQITGCGF